MELSKMEEGTENEAQDGNVRLISQKRLEPFIHLSDMANIATFLTMIFGFALQYGVERNMITRLITAFGLFGFAGGITNWLAVKMLFDHIPLLFGSGVIPRRFKEIRQAIKESVLEMFFDKAFLESYLGPRSRELLASMNLPALLKTTASAPDFDEMFIAKLTELSLRPEGLMLQTIAQMFGGVPLMAPTLKPMLIAFGEDMISVLVDKFDPTTVISVDKLRSEIDNLMTDKLQQLTPERVKEIMEDVIRRHLGWLVVWGNIFGGLIGIISVLAGYEG